MNEVRLTPEGLAQKEARLDYLKTTRRLEIAEQIKIARSFGDLSENAEYDAAKNEQARNEYEIVELEALLRNAVVIDEKHVDTRVVNIGTTIKVRNLDLDLDFEYQIVSSAEADPLKMRISNESPVGQGLLGRKVDDIAEISTPGGTSRFQILAISK